MSLQCFESKTIGYLPNRNEVIEMAMKFTIYKLLLMSYTGGIFGGLLAAADPVVAFNVFLLAALFAAIGGVGAAIRDYANNKERNTGELIIQIFNLAINMGVFGAGIAMVGFWWMKPDSNSQWFLIGFAGLSGLIGLRVLEPLAGAISRTMEKMFGRFSDAVDNQGDQEKKNNGPS